MGMYVTLTKKRLFIILGVLVLAFIFFSQFWSFSANSIDLSTNAKRVEYLQTLGISLESDNYTKKDITIPWEFSDVYKKYNVLQNKAGFNLTDYRGKKVTDYTYRISDSENANLIICDGKLIGGDISSIKIGGEMLPLNKGT